ncbi:MAG: flagellar basal body P-ring formation chaperone FlgA [Phycisphaerales bacterium]
MSKTVASSIQHMSMLIPFIAIMATLQASADTITLKRSVRLQPAQQQLTLQDIAMLEGGDAMALAETVVWRHADGKSNDQIETIELRSIQGTLTQAGARWGSVHLSGQNVRIRRSDSAAGAGPVAMQPLQLPGERAAKGEGDAQPSNGMLATSALDQPTVRAEIAARILRGSGQRSDDVMLSFDIRDAAILDTRLETFRVELEPLSSLTSDRVDVAVRLWSGTSLTQEHRVTVGVVVAARVAYLTEPCSRGDVIRSSALREVVEWLPPSEARIHAATGNVEGMMATKHLKAGDVLRSRDLEAAKVIARGDRVRVRCLSGGIIIAFEAEARHDAGLGQLLEMKRYGERDTFTAIVAAAGEAVIDLQAPLRVGGQR